MARPKGLTDEEAAALKADLTNGMSTGQLMKIYQVSQPFISLLRRGFTYAEVPWPDGSIGPMPVKPVRRPAGMMKDDEAFIRDCAPIYHKLLRSAQQAGFPSVKAWTDSIRQQLEEARHGEENEPHGPVAFTAYDKANPLPSDWKPQKGQAVGNLHSLSWEEAVAKGGPKVEKRGEDVGSRRALQIVMAGWEGSVDTDQFDLAVQIVKEYLEGQDGE